MTGRILQLRLFVALMLIGIGVVTTSTLVLYNISIKSISDRVETMSRSYARLINSAARFDKANFPDSPLGSSREGTLLQVRQAQLNSTGFGDTGEYVLGELNGDRIDFLLPARKTDKIPAGISSESKAAAPMRQALLGKAGVIFAPDYRGDMVIAGYQPLPNLKAGFVAKINIEEIRSPYLKAFFWGLVYVFIVSVLSSLAFSFFMGLSAVRNASKQQTISMIALTTCLLFIAGGSASLIIGNLYTQTIKRQRSELYSLNQGLSSTINAMARFDKQYYGDLFSGGSSVATFTQINDAMRFEPGFEESGEFVIGRIAGDRIEFLLSSRFTGKPSSSIRVDGTKAEPMRRALAGESGVITDLDYREKKVFAAFNPVDTLGVGLVTKIDLKDIYRPFLVTGYINICYAIFFVVFGVLLAPKIIGEAASPKSAHLFNSSAQTKPSDLWQLNNTPVFTWAIAVISLMLILLLDVLTPLGVAAGIPYVTVIVIGAWLLDEHGVLLLGVLSSALLFAGMLLSPMGDVLLWNALVNRLFALFIIWFVVLILLRNKRVENSLRQSEDQMFTFIDSAPDATIIVDSRHIIRMANRQVDSIFGYKCESLLGESVQVLIPESFNERHDGQQKVYMESPKARSMGIGKESLALRKSGEVFPAEINLSPIYTDDGLFVAASIRDVTERKKAEQELQQAYRTIEVQKNRMEKELNVGREIQMSMLPLIFPAFPSRKELDVYAVLESAREVGGDFYDFFFLDDGRFCFVIGDVSGKGVPSALFMAVTKTLIKSRASDDSSTASILTHVNEELSRDNKAYMFVTVFMGILNTVTGEMQYTNAGHNPPYILRKDGSLEALAQRHGPVIGAVKGLAYKEDTTLLIPGDMAYLYTDGVTEAKDHNNSLFTEKRLEKVLSSRRYASTEDLVKATVEETKKFEQGVEQADDITVMAVEYYGMENKPETQHFEITIKNRLPEIEKVVQSFETFADKQGLEVKIRREMKMVFDEMLNNIISYAFQQNEEHEIEIRISLTTDCLTLVISDDGSPFNPFGLEAPDTDLPLEQRKIGGMGIHLVRKVMDDVLYQRKIEKNVVTLTKSIKV